MNPREPRRIWLVTHHGIPQGCAWAMVKTWDEAEPGRESWAAALAADQLLADGWDATPTQWRRVPQAIRPELLGQAPARVVGRDVIAAGLRYNLDTGGRVHSSHKEGNEREPYEPDAVVDSEPDLLAAAEAIGREIRFVERDTLKAWRASHAAEAAADRGEDVLIHRAGGQATRTDRGAPA